MADLPLILRVTLLTPPAGVMYALQEGDETPVSQALSTGADLIFDIPVHIAEGPKGLRWLGPYIRREGDRRFAYFRVGTCAGQHDSPWTRRGKIWLTDIDDALVRQAATSGRRLEASFPGTDKHGTPTCATVRPVGGWALG